MINTNNFSSNILPSTQFLKMCADDVVCSGQGLNESADSSEAKECIQLGIGLLDFWITVNRDIFAVLKVGKFVFFQLAVDKILRLL
jgi:hypothetical protein